MQFVLDQHSVRILLRFPLTANYVIFFDGCAFLSDVQVTRISFFLDYKDT